MEVVKIGVSIIDIENNTVISHIPTEEFDNYVKRQLVSYVKENESTRDYRTRTTSTVVIRQILDLCEIEDEIARNSNMLQIAKWLLECEIKVDLRMKHIVKVQRGSLLQVLLYEDEDDTLYYLLAKIEHSDWFDDADWLLKKGFSIDKKSISKSCIFTIPRLKEDVYYAKVYVRNPANYWSDDFLELKEVKSNEVNTKHSFDAVDKVLGSNVRRDYSRDYVVLRNSLIGYYRTHKHINYHEMIDSIITNYDPAEMPRDKLIGMKRRLDGLPEKKDFDTQFSSVSSCITAKMIRRVYDVNPSVKIQIVDEINVDETITSFQDEKTGKRYIKILAEDSKTYRSFKKS